MDLREGHVDASLQMGEVEVGFLAYIDEDVGVTVVGAELVVFLCGDAVVICDVVLGSRTTAEGYVVQGAGFEGRGGYCWVAGAAWAVFSTPAEADGAKWLVAEGGVEEHGGSWWELLGHDVLMFAGL